MKLLNCSLVCLLGISQSLFAQPLQEVKIVSSLDQTDQRAMVQVPDDLKERVPLVVLLHTWSGNYRQKGHIEEVARECEKRGWALIHPDFRGPNWTRTPDRSIW